MSNLSNESSFAWDYGLPSSPPQRRLSVSDAYDYDGYVDSFYDPGERRTRSPLDAPTSASQPVLSSKRTNLSRAQTGSPNDAYSYYGGARKAWDDDDMYGLGTRFSQSSASLWEEAPAEEPLPTLRSSRRQVDDLSRAFFTELNKGVQDNTPEPLHGMAAMYQRPMRKPKPLPTQESVRLRNEARELANAVPDTANGFYDISSEVAPKVRVLTPPHPAEPLATPTPPTNGKSLMKEAEVSWGSVPEIAAEEASKNSKADSDDERMASLYADSAIQEVVAVVEPTEADGNPSADAVVSEEPVANALAQRPASLEPSRIYVGVPQLAPTPVLRREVSVVAEKRGSTRSTGSAANSSGGAYEADEVMRINYNSGEMQRAGVLEMMRMHFLSGHNGMIIVMATQRCNAVAEDFVATTVSTVFREGQSMGAQFTNAFAVSAYALLPDDKTSNLLPTAESETMVETIGLASNPISGTVIHNYRPVTVLNEGEGTYLGRAAIRNARVLGFDPYVNKDAMMCVTVHLKQSRHTEEAATTSSPNRSALAAKKGTANEPASSPHDVYVSSLKLLFVGSNVEALSRVIEKEPDGVWPLVRQSFGGCCRTCIATFVERDDPGLHADRLLKLSDTLSEYENLPPRSGSVRKFLLTLALSGADELWSQESVSINRFREDAEALMQNPETLPAFYPVPGTHGRVRKRESSSVSRTDRKLSGSRTDEYEQASRVIVLKPLETLTATEVTAARAVTPKQPTPRTPTPRTPTPKQPAPRDSGPRPLPMPPVSAPPPREATPPPSPLRLLSPPELVARQPAVETVLVPVKPRQIIVESAARSPAIAADQGVDDIHVDMPHSVRIRENDARKMESMRRKLQEATAEKWPTLRLTDSVRDRDHDDDSTVGSNHRRGPPQSVASRLRDEWQNSKRESVHKVLPDPDIPFRTVVLVFSSEEERAASARKNAPNPLLQRTDDTHVLLTMPPQPPSQECVKCRFQVDEVRASTNDAETAVDLLLSFSSLERLQEAFTVKQLNAAVLVTDLTGGIQPFRSQPIWGAFHSMMHTAIQLRQRGAEVDDALPFKLTLFASVLRGKKLLKDLAATLCDEDDTDSHVTHSIDASQMTANRTLSDAGSATSGVRIGTSPLFGALLYETRGVDITDVSAIASYLAATLELADKVADDDPEVYLIFTCVQHTATRLSPSELLPMEVEQGRLYDARFSSYTVISTRCRVDMFEHGLQGNPTQYPIHMFEDTLVGKVKTVCVLTADQSAADPDTTMRAMLMQHKAKTFATTRYQIRKDLTDRGVPRSPSQSPRTLAHRHNSARAYVRECEGAAHALRECVARKELPQATRDDLLARASTYEGLAEQHMVFLTEPSGYALLTYRAMGPGALQVDASHLVEPVASTGLSSRGTSPVSTPARSTATTTTTTTAAAATPSVASRTLELPPSPHSTRTANTPTTAKATSAPAHGPATPRTSTSKSSAERGTGFLSSDSLRTPRKLGSQASTKAPSFTGSADDGSVDAAPKQAPRSLVATKTASGDLASAGASAEHAVHSSAGHLPTTNMIPTPPAIAGPQLTPQRLPAEAGLTSRSIVLMATDVALTKLMRHSDAGGSTPASDAGGSGDVTTIAETSRVGELAVAMDTSDGAVQQVFKFDDVICLSAAAGSVTPSNLSEVNTRSGMAMPPSIPTGINPNTLFKSSVLVAGLQGFLAGSNVAVVLQETTEAFKTTLVEQLLRMIVSVCTRERPAEATLFLSMCFVNEEQTADLLVERGRPPMVPITMSFAPLGGPFVSSAVFHTLQTPQEGQDMLTRALRTERTLAASHLSGHLLVVTIWQKLVLEAEGDVSLSAITVVAGRASPSILRRHLKATASPVKVLLRYVLGGPCYTICATCVTDAEPGALAVGEKNTAMYMMAYQSAELCNISGRPVTGNSYRDLLHYHRTSMKRIAAEISELSAEVNALKLRQESEGVTPESEALLHKKKKKIKSLGAQGLRFSEMAKDETAVLKTAVGGVSKEAQSAIPPFYSAMP